MKKLLLLSLLAAALYGCKGGFSKGTKIDMTTGLSASYNGFSLEDIYLATGENDTRISSNKVTLNSKISILATGVDRFTETNGMVFPGCTIILTDTSGKEILHIDDAFSNMKQGTSKETARLLRAVLTTGAPMLVGETYHLQTRFFDKGNKDSEIVAGVDLLVN